MKRKSQVLVLAILGLTVLGFNLIAAVDAGKPPPFEDAVQIAWWQDTTICESEASYYFIGWYWYIDEVDNEWEEFPVPIKVEYQNLIRVQERVKTLM